MTQPSYNNTAAARPPHLYLAPSVAPSRRTLSPRLGYAVAALVVGLGLFASVTPSPLYRSYSVLWHFSPLTLTLIYATYAFGVLASLLLAGGVSDDVGRRPVLLAALAALMASSVLFMVAGSAAWLFVARGVQGLATGAALSAASAALLDLHPNRDPAGVGLTTATAAAGGIGLGVLTSSVLVQLGTLPRVLPYVVLLVLFALAFAGAYWMPEPIEERGRFRLKAQRPRVPAVVRRPFLLATLAVLSSWSIGGLFFSLGPQLAAHLFNSSNAIVSGSGIVALAGAAVVAQLLTARSAPWIGAGAGSIALASGMVLIVFAASRDSSAAYLAGSILAGAGFGAAFLGGLRTLAAAIPPQHRAAVMSAFYVAAYTSLSLPAVLAGIVVAHVALPTTFEIFGSVVAAIALVVAFEAWRTRRKKVASRNYLGVESVHSVKQLTPKRKDLAMSTSTIVLVHGAFGDASSWRPVFDRLVGDGHNVLAPPNPLRGLPYDAAYTAAMIDELDGPVVLVGHSYGGAVITVAGTSDKVTGLVYVAGVAPDEGESVNDLQSRFPALAMGPLVRPLSLPDGSVEASIDPARFHDVFCADLPDPDAAFMAISQRTVSAAAFDDPATAAAWRTKPSWAVFGTGDYPVAPALHRFSFERAGSTVTEVEGASHFLMRSQPDVVAEVIRDAVRASAVNLAA